MVVRSPAIAYSPRSYLAPGYLALSGLRWKACAGNTHPKAKKEVK